MRYAHTLPDTLPEEWEPLEDHLTSVAQQASSFAEWLGKARGGSAEWGRLAGLWHDLGKYSQEFQNKLLVENDLEAHIEHPGRVNHSSAGAQYAADSAGQWARLMAYVIAGHHAGLAEASRLAERLQEDIPDWNSFAPAELVECPPLPPPPLSRASPDQFAFRCSLFTRMLFSCLIDADRLETERFCSPERADQRQPPPGVAELLPTFNSYMEQLAANAESTPVNAQRSDILQACRDAASLQPGLFSLTVPTGGGKTLASLAFALEHAGRHGLRRVVMAIPFTSIIEQTAEVYRRVFAPLGEGVVVEHHSNLDPEKETRQNHLAAENWDAPLIVSTNVQLLDSLFACRTTPCRKLHRIAGSVIILDEAQTLPVTLLGPCLELLRALAADYGCTIVLCTATQPALKHRENFPIGLEDVREIIPEPEKLYTAMRRVETARLGPASNEQLVDRLAAEPSWLTIVNTKPHAAALYARIKGNAENSPEDLFHLSTLMCAAHRAKKLKAIRQRLNDKLPCRVVSTQLIEAGVDVDFPVVFRAAAGIDSLAQAAGRCNREGKLPGLGKLWLFEPTDVKLHGRLLDTVQKANEVLPDFDDPLDPQAVEKYFQLYYWSQSGANNWDEPDVLNCFPEEKGQFYYDFRTAAERFQLIEDNTKAVYVPYGTGDRLIEQLRSEGPNRYLLRKLQRFMVGVYENRYRTLLASQDIQEVPDWGFSILENPSLYDDDLGLLVDRPGYYQPEALIP